MISKCIYCQSDKTIKWVIQKKSNQVKQKIVKCNNCNTIFPEKSMSEDESRIYIHNELYDINKYNVNTFKEAVSKDYFVVKKIKEYFRNGENALDVGGHIGGFIYNLQEIGYDTYGLDIYKNAVDFAIRMGQNMYQSQFIEDLPYSIESKSFSLITFMESLYYFKDPKTVLLKTKSLLNQNGLLVIQTINGDSKYFKNHTFFSRYGDNVQFMPTFKSIKYWLEDLNFNVLEIIALPRFSINQLLKYDKSFKSIIRKCGLFLNHLDYKNRTPLESSDKLIIIARKI